MLAKLKFLYVVAAGWRWQNGKEGTDEVGIIVHNYILDVNGEDIYPVRCYVVVGAGGLPASDYYGYSPFARAVHKR